ncbi:MAG: M4 family metallopeptidase [bacterium]
MKKNSPRVWILGFCLTGILAGMAWLTASFAPPTPARILFQISAAEKARLLAAAKPPRPAPANQLPSKFTTPPQKTRSAQAPDPATAKVSLAGLTPNLPRPQTVPAMPPGNAPNAAPRKLRGLPRGSGRTVPDPYQQQAIGRLLDQLGPEADLQMDNLSRTLRCLRGDLSRVVANSETYRQARSRGDFGAMALALAGELNVVMNIRDPRDEFSTEKVSRDELGMTHVLLQQKYKDLPVWGAQVGVHFNQMDNPIQISGVYTSTPVWMPEPARRIGPRTAIQKAQEELQTTGPGLVQPTAEPMIYWDLDRAPEMTYRVDLTPSLAAHWQVFVSMESGRIVHKLQAICSQAATGQSPDLNNQPRTVNCWNDNGVYYAIDTSRPIYNSQSQPPVFSKIQGALMVLDAQNQDVSTLNQIPIARSSDVNRWDPTVVSVLSNFATVEEYYRQTFNRNSIDGKGMSIVGIVHARFKDANGNPNSDNAFWSSSLQMMMFGDGEQDFKNLPEGLDVTGHELTHGVINHSANLIYENQSGALNEHLADLFGTMVDPGDWLIGEDIVARGEALRDMQDPHNPNVQSPQPKIMAEYQNLANTPQTDNGGVHVNSGIPNYMSYLLTDGPNGVGRDKSQRILYRAMTEYLTQRSQFLDYRRAVLSAAKDLYGDNSPETQAVNSAFDAVGIVDGETPGPTEPTPAPTGQEQVVFLAADPNIFQQNGEIHYLLVLYDNGQFTLVSPRYVSNTRPAISGDGSFGLYVDETHNLYLTDGINEQLIRGQNDIRTIALSKDLRYVAYTTTPEDNLIHVRNMKTGEERTAELNIPRVDGNLEALDYADVLTFNHRGDYLIFDAVHNGVWGLYSLRVVDLAAQQVAANTPGEQLGNPIFANYNDSLLLADYFVSQGGQTAVAMIALDFDTNQMGILQGGLNIAAHPTFRGDDQRVVFRSGNPDQNAYFLYEAELQEGEVALKPNSQKQIATFNLPFSYPIGFQVGTYTPVEGKIAVPDSITFADTPVLSESRQDCSIQNTGNGDITIIGIDVEGDDADSFRHTGINQVIGAGKALTFEVVFAPQRPGLLSARLRVKSTDFNNPDVTVPLSGTGAAAAITPTPTQVPPTATPTSTPTASPTLQPQATPTKSQEPGPTPTPQSGGGILAVYEFDQDTLEADGWFAIPGGFNTADPGTIQPAPLIFGLIPSSRDKKGLAVTVSPGQVAFLAASSALPTGGKPVLLRMTAQADAPNASLFVVALKGGLAGNQGVDGSLAYHNPVSAAQYMERERVFVLLYEPDSGDTITPIIQVAGTGPGGPATVYIDKLEVLSLDPGQSYPGALFRSAPGAD